MNHPQVHSNESFNRNISRLILFYNQLAIHYLQKQSNVNENVHQARLCFKRIRSYLRLGRKGLGRQVYAQYNSFYRDQSRALSQLRDLTAILETLQAFIKTRRTPASKSALIKLRNQLLVQRKQQMQNIVVANPRSGVLLALQNISEPIAEWNFEADAASVFVAGTQRVYKRGKCLFEMIRTNPDDHQFHEWRKQVKYSWYHLLALKPLWPGMVTALAREVQMLSQKLGKHHDLVLLENILRSFQVQPEHNQAINNTLRSIRLKKHRLEKESIALGSKIYIESPASFGSRLAAYWK